MATNISQGFNMRFLTLRRGSKNTFTLNDVSTKMEPIIFKGFPTLGRDFKNTSTPNPGGAFFNNMGFMRESSSKTLGRMGKRSAKVIPEFLSALEQARRFADGQGDFSLERSSSLYACRKLEQAEKFFQNASYKKAKKSFKGALQSELGHQEKKIVQLYLVTICLLLNNKHAVKEYRKAIALLGEVAPYKKGDAISLTQAIYAHLHRLIQEKEAPESIKGPFLIHQLYGKTENFSKNEKVMAKSLYEKFCLSND
ncbi:MAG: hypothetical protein C5B45_03970 [Chlamydiae bacterium]|nr:MAG: hypothetical protein C5B45_03970 [Chlamydiota bacterium]